MTVFFPFVPSRYQPSAFQSTLLRSQINWRLFWAGSSKFLYALESLSSIVVARRGDLNTYKISKGVGTRTAAVASSRPASVFVRVVAD